MSTDAPNLPPRKPTKRKRVPRLSLAVTMLRDPDVLALCRHGIQGWAAGWTFVQLCLAAHDADNGGRFVEPIDIIAEMIHLPPEAILGALQLIEKVCKANGNEPWIVMDGGKLFIRNLLAWNPGVSNWGGARKHAGRKGSGKTKKYSRRNQDEFKMNSSCAHSVSIPLTGNGDSADVAEGPDAKALLRDAGATSMAEYVERLKRDKPAGQPALKLAGTPEPSTAQPSQAKQPTGKRVASTGTPVDPEILARVTGRPIEDVETKREQTVAALRALQTAAR